MPKIVAQIQTGGDRIDVDRAITPPTAAEQQQIRECLAKLGVTLPEARQGSAPGANPGGGLGGGQGGGRARSAPAPSRSCLPERMRRFRATITTPRETLQQVLDPPQTDITSESYTIGGVQLGDPDYGPRHRRAGHRRPLSEGRARGARRRDVRGAEVAEGRLEARPQRDVVHRRRSRRAAARRPGRRRLPAARAAPEALRPEGSRQRRARPRRRQRLGRPPSSSGSRTPTRRREVASAKQVADTISGSLVDAANLSRSLGLALSIVAAVAAFLLAALAHALLRRQAGARARDAEGARLDAGQGRAAGRRRVAHHRECSAASSASCSASAPRS